MKITGTEIELMRGDHDSLTTNVNLNKNQIKKRAYYFNGTAYGVS